MAMTMAMTQLIITCGIIKLSDEDGDDGGDDDDDGDDDSDDVADDDDVFFEADKDSTQ